MFEVGEIARVRDDLEVEKKYGSLTWHSNRRPSTDGRMATIMQIHASGNIDTYESFYAYSAEMLQKLFDWEAFKRGEFAVHCEAQEESSAFALECGKQNIECNPLEWMIYGSDTCHSMIYAIRYVGYSRKAFYEKNGHIVINYKNLYFEGEITMKTTDQIKKIEEKLEKITGELEQITAAVKELKKPEFTLEGFLGGEFSVSFKNDFEKGVFLGWLQANSDARWLGGKLPVEVVPPVNIIAWVYGGLRYTGFSAIPTLPFDPSWLKPISN